MLKRNLFLAGAGALAAALVGAPIAADVIAYRTEDGVFAYTDDHDKVPARYRADAVTVRDTALKAYPQLTLEDTPTARAVTARLEKRLDYLRQVNAASAAEREVAETAARKNTVFSIPTGHGTASPMMEVTAGGGAGPIVVDPILTTEFDRGRTRRTTLVKQGDEILAVVKGPQHHFNVNEDIYEEDELLPQSESEE
jgi:hypothetical protein